MTVDEHLRDDLHRRAASVEPSIGAWTTITSRIDRRQRRSHTLRVTLVAGMSCAAVVLALAVVTIDRPDHTGQNVAATGGTNPAVGPTTTYVGFSTPTTTGDESGMPGSTIVGGPGAADPGANAGPSGPATASSPGVSQPDPQMTSTGFHVGTIWPETAAEIERLQAEVANGHQPWRLDPAAVAAAYLSERGLATSGDGAPRSIGEFGALRYMAGGVGGWVSVAQTDGGIFHVEGSRSDRIVLLRAARQGGRVGVDVMATEPGSVVVRTKRLGSDWNESVTRTVEAGQPVSLTVDGQAATSLLVQVRHEGNDGRIGLSEQYLGSTLPALGYEGIHDGSTLGPSSLGVISLTMRLAEVERMAGIAMTYDRSTDACTTLSPVGRPEGVDFLSFGGSERVDAIVVSAPGVRTDAGIGVGSTVAEVRQAYPGIEERLADDRGRLVHSPDDPILHGFEMVFEIIGGGVAGIWSGGEGLANTDELCA